MSWGLIFRSSPEMKIPFYQVDAFAGELFKGNPAAVCVLDSWPADALMQSIAAENNLSETAFFVKNPDGSYQLRWFTPTFEIPLCGHATLASGFVIFEYLQHRQKEVRFRTLSGELILSREANKIVMDFPAYKMQAEPFDDAIVTALGGRPKAFYKAAINCYAVFDSENEVRNLEPDYSKLLDLMRDSDIIGYVPTAAADQDSPFDIVSRYLAPEEGLGMTEDPVTGSIHCALIPYWSGKLGKTRIHAYQASKRGGELFCDYDATNQRVKIAGEVKPYLKGFISV